MRAVRLVLALAFVVLSVRPTPGQEIGDWMVTRRRTCRQYSLVRNDPLACGQLVQVYGFGDRTVETLTGDRVGSVPLCDLMSPIEAIAFFSKKIENCSHPLSGESDYIARGNSYYAVGCFQEAIADYTAALRIRPRDAEALLGRAAARHRQGDAGLAERDLDAAFKIKPELVGIAERSGYRPANSSRTVVWAFSDARDDAVYDIVHSTWTGGIGWNERFYTTGYMIESVRPWYERPFPHPFATSTSIERANIRQRLAEEL